MKEISIQLKRNPEISNLNEGDINPTEEEPRDFKLE
jgi:hypothetical protein